MHRLPDIRSVISGVTLAVTALMMLSGPVAAQDTESTTTTIVLSAPTTVAPSTVPAPTVSPTTVVPSTESPTTTVATAVLGAQESNPTPQLAQTGIDAGLLLGMSAALVGSGGLAIAGSRRRRD